MNYETGPNFRGMSMIPPGLHFIYFSTGLGSRQGFFIQCAEGDLVVRSWDPANEEITATNVLSDASMAALRLSLERGELNHQLGPYPFPQHHTWLNISSHISASVLERTDCAPGSMVIPGVAEDMEALPGGSNSNSSNSSTAVKHYFPGLARVARFADLAAAEASLREAAHAHVASPDRAQLLTSLYMDKTSISQHLVESYFGGSWSELLGEMQLAFVLFLLVFSHPALVYWKAAVHLVCCSEKLVRQQPSVVASFIKSFHAQLNFSPEDFFEIELSRENFLRPSLSALFATLSGDDVPDPLPEYSRRLLKFVRKKFDLYHPDGKAAGQQNRCGAEAFNLVDEDMPVVVEMKDISADAMGMDRDDAAAAAEGEDHHDSSTSPSLARRRSLCEEQRAELVQGLEQRWGTFDAMVGSSPPPPPPPPPSAFVSSTTVLPAELMEPAPTVEVVVMMDAPMSPTEMETALFGWRYPLLYEANKNASGREDFIMTAARVVAEGGSGDEVGAYLYKEAVLFIDNEHSLR